MKRDLASPGAASNAESASDDWLTGAADILDSYDDVMWDEIHDLSPPQTLRSELSAQVESQVTPLDAIYGASPIKRPGVGVHALESYSGGATASIRGGEDQESLAPLAGGGTSFGFNVSFNHNQLNTVWTATQPEDFERKALVPTWPVPVPPVSSSVSDTPSDSCQPRCSKASDIRRQKNREWMRRARHKQRKELDKMRITVARLEKQYAELSLLSSTGGSALVPQTRRAADYSQAAELARRLGAENLYLKAEIQQQAMWKLNLTRILQSCPQVDGPRWAQQFQQPALGGEEVLRMQLDQLDEVDAAQEFGFHALTDLDLTRVILQNSRTISRVQSRLLIPSSSDTDYGARTRRMQTFGWDMVQRVHGNIMECVFTKKFKGINVATLMQKTWANDMRLGEYKKVKGETCRLEVLQQVNPNAYVVGRDVMSPTEDISTFRSVYVRFLIETSRRLPASNGLMTTPTCIDASSPTTPPQYTDSDSECDEVMLEATGFVLGTQCIDTDFSRYPRAEDVRNKVAWAHVSLSIEFLNVVNPVTREEYQQLRWSGRTDYCGPEHAQRNASDMMQGMLRWELLVISPALNLVALP